MMYLYTFLVDIGRYSVTEMNDVLKILISSLDFSVKKYTLIIFTNIEILIQNEKIIIRKYYDKEEKHYGNNKWLNLSFNKINIYKDLHDEFQINYTWIDLDTVIVGDISYINELSNFFTENGGYNEYQNVLFSNNLEITVPRKNYIQGNMWKLNIELYHDLINCFRMLKEKKLILRYDLQDLFNYYIYILGNKDKVNILGNNCKINTINGLCVWSKEGIGHATLSGLKNLYFENNVLKSKYYAEKEIHILSFTFYTLLKLYNTIEFKNLLDIIN